MIRRLLFLFVLLAPSLQAQTVPPTIIQEIGIAVTDVQLASREYSRLLGIAQWQYSDLYAEGDAAFPAVRMASGNFGNTRIALLQPLAGESPLKTHLQQHGSGIFHLGLMKSAQKKRPPAKAFGLSDRQGYRAQWLDTYETLGVNLLLMEGDAVASWGTLNYPAANQLSNDKRVVQLGLISGDLQTQAMAFFQQLGIGPWLVVDFKAPHITHAFYLGASAKDDTHIHIKVAYATWGDLQLELLMPVEGPSPHRDFLISHGAGAHHLSLGPVADHDTLVASYQQAGIEVQLQSDNGGEGRTATYLDTLKPLAFVLELPRPYQGPGTLPVLGTIPVMPRQVK